MKFIFASDGHNFQVILKIISLLALLRAKFRALQLTLSPFRAIHNNLGAGTKRVKLLNCN